MVSKHVVRVRGKRRKMKVRDIQGWMLSAMAVSSQMQVKALTSPEMSCFESQSLFLSDSPPTPFPDMPDGLTDLFQHNWSKMIPVLASGKFQERWVSLFQSELDHQVAASKHIL